MGNFLSKLNKAAMSVFFIASVLAGTENVCGRTLSFDLRPPVAARRMVSAAPSSQGSVLRSVRLGAGVAAAEGEIGIGDELVFALFDDVTITLTLKEKMQSPLGGDVFLAEVSGYEGMKTAVVLSTEDGLTIDVQDFLKNKVYKVISAQAGVKVLEIKPSRDGDGRCAALEPPLPTTVPSSRKSLATAVQGDSCVDVLVAYEKKAAEFADENGGITNFAQVAVQKMNAALANTGLDEKFRYRLVGVCPLQVTETDLTSALLALFNNQEGWKEVKTYRDTVGADIVSTLVDTGSAHGTLGVGWQLTPNFSLTGYGAEHPYNVCSIRSVMEAHTMTHECGHNLGAGHSDVQRSQPGPQLFSYSSGYFFVAGGKAYGTIMAYEYQNPSGEPTEEVPFFSSPDFAYDGVAVGDATHDNTRTIANTFAYAANWKAQKVPMSYDVIFSPPSGTLIDRSLDVTLSSGSPGVEIRYTLDGSVPTSESPVYSAPIHLTETTKIKACTVVDGVCALSFTASYPLKATAGFALRMFAAEWQCYGNLPSPYKGGTFNGYAKDADGKITGTFVLKVKPPAKKKKELDVTLTFTSLATGKKTKKNGSVNLSTGEGSGGLSGLLLGVNAIGGTVVGLGSLEGGADAAKAKDKTALAVLGKFKGKKYVVAFAPENSGSQGGYSALEIAFSTKGKAKVTGVLADGTKVTASSQMTVGDLYCCVPVLYSKKSKFGFVVWFDKDTHHLVAVTGVTPWRNTAKNAFTMPWRVSVQGAKGSLPGGGRTVTLDGGKLRSQGPGAIGQTPQTIPLTVKGKRWITDKAAKVAYRGGSVTVTGKNVAALKLMYTANTGMFRGSFTVYAVKGGKLIKNRFLVFGAVVNGTAYGTAVLKGKGSVAVVVE